MKKIIALTLAILLLTITFAGCGGNNKQSIDAIKKAGKIVMFTNAEFPPFEYMSNNKPVGVDVDIANEIAKDIGVTLEIKNIEFDSIISSVSTGKGAFGAAGMSVNEERKQSVDFSIEYVTSVQYIIVKSGTAITKFEDLAGKKISVQKGTTGDFIVTDQVDGTKDDAGKHVKGSIEGTGATVVRYANAIEGASALTSGKVDAVVIDKLPAQSIVANSKGALKCIELVNADGSKTEEKYAICVAKGNTSLLEAINKTLDKLIKEGKIDQFIITQSANAAK